jgi:two-component system sensor histidine kinase MprB
VLAVTVTLVVLVVAGVTYLLVVHQLERGQDVALLREATRIQRLVDSNASDLASGSATCQFASEPACSRVVDLGAPVESGTSPMRVTDEARAVASGQSGAEYYTVAAPTGGVRVVALPIRESGAAPGGGAVLVGVPTSMVDRTAARVGTALLVLGLVGVVLSGGIGFAVATVGLRPVRALAASVDRVTKSRNPRDGTLHSDRDDELGRLSRSFDLMLDQLADAQTAQTQLIADASHELRSPLTSLRTNLALLNRGDAIAPERRELLRRSVRDELLSLQLLVDDLVDLARGVERETDVHDVDVAEVFRTAAVTAGRHWPSARFELDAPVPVVVEGAEERLGRLASVLLDNAGKYGGAGDVEVEVRAEQSGGAKILVSDRGPGIAEADRRRVFDRFFRSGAARSHPGSGLGLAIAHQIVVAHGGAIVAEPRRGAGTRIVVSLPGTPASRRGPAT